MSSNEKVDAYMPLWIGAYLADTLTFTTLQHGAYMLLLMAYWRERAPLIDEDESLRSIAKADRADWKKLRPVLARKFQVGAGVWKHKRVEQELVDAEQRKAKATAKAKAAAEARWSKSAEQSLEESSEDASSNAQSNAQALLKDCPTTSTTESSVPPGSNEPSGTGAYGAEPPPPPRPKETDPEVILFNIGVPYLVKADIAEKHARSFLGGLRKVHGDGPVVDALRDCMRAKPMQPLEWLAAALPPPATAGKQSALEARNAAVVAEVLGEDDANE